MPFDATLPANGSPIVSAELRNQFTALKALIDDINTQLAALNTTVAAIPTALGPPNLTVSNPPTQAEVQAIADYVNSLYAVLTWQ